MSAATDFSFALAFEGLQKRDESGSARAPGDVTLAGQKWAEFASVRVPEVDDTPAGLKDLASRIADAEALAALSGCFSPTALGEGLTKDPLVLGALGTACAPATGVQEGRWILKWGDRIRTLRRLIAQGELDDLLRRKLPETDEFGVALRELLAGGELVGAPNDSSGYLLAYSAAYDVAEELGMARRPRWLPYLIESGNAARARSILTRGFVGRRPELDELLRFVTHPGHPNHETLIVSGLGGSGKSALLGRLVEELGESAITCTIDFDLPGVDPSDESLLDGLLARQLGVRLGQSAFRLIEAGRIRLKRARARTRREGGAKSLERVANTRAERDVLRFVARAIETHGGNVRTLMVILDTAEEVPLAMVPRLASWVRGVAFGLGRRIALRVVVSGRLFDQVLEEWQMVLESERTIVLEQLERGDAERLLVQQGVAPEQAKRLLETGLLPCRPLELRLLARIIQDQGIASAEALEHELRNGGDATRQLFAGLVYKRILSRVTEDIRAIAHPGLVLRYVTVDLLREVLVPALEMKPVSEPEAKKLLDKLASYAWLASRHGDQVWHRKDLRESVLLAMAAHEAKAAARIHERAVRYFREHKDEESALYHRLMLWGMRPGSASAPTLQDVRMAASALGAYQGELPRPAAVYIRFATQGRVEPEDVKLLPAEHRRAAASESGRNLVALGEYGKARSLIEDVRSTLDKAKQEQESWERETLFVTGAWSAIESPQIRRVRTFSELVDRLYPMPGNRDRDFRLALFAALDRVQLGEDSGQLSIDVERFSVSLAVLVDSLPLSGEEARVIHKLAKRISKEAADRELSAATNRVLLLDLFADSESRHSAHCVATPHTMSLHPNWIHRLRYLPAYEGYQDALRALADAIEKSTKDAPTIEGFLAQVDALAARDNFARDVKVHIATLNGREFAEGLFGVAAHLRGLSRYALLDEFGAERRWEELARLIRECAPHRLSGLAELAPALARDAEHALVLPLEYIDRCGQMRRLLQFASRQARNPLLRQALRAHDQWRRVLLRHWEPWSSPAYTFKRVRS